MIDGVTLLDTSQMLEGDRTEAGIGLWLGGASLVQISSASVSKDDSSSLELAAAMQGSRPKAGQ